MTLFLSLSGFICCGTEYINSSTSLCCSGNDGYPIIHPAGNATVTLKCCGSMVIHQDEECCSGVGFDPQQHVCADRATPGLLIQVCVFTAEIQLVMYINIEILLKCTASFWIQLLFYTTFAHNVFLIYLNL